MKKQTNSRQDAYAVIIGINRYLDPLIPDLGFARADAEGVYQTLIDPELGQLSPDNVILLLDEDATQRKIRSAIGTQIPRRAEERDKVLIYYAGHGAPVVDPKTRSQDGMEKYLIPHDAELDDLRASGISMDEIQKFFGWIESKQVLFFIDSCYSGEAGGRTFQQPSYQKRAALTDEFLNELAGEGRLVITACDVNEVSLELADLGHGIFTHYLIEGLKGKADSNNDGLVTERELYEYVYENVSRQARLLGGSMHPIYKGSVMGKLFLTRYETEAQKQARGLHERAEALFKTGKVDEAYDLWQKVLRLVPDHEQASRGVKEIEIKRQEERRKRQQIQEQKQRILFRYYEKGSLPPDEFNQAMNLIEKEPDKLSESDRKVRKLLDDLTDENITISTYLRCIRLLKKPDEAEPMKPTPKLKPEAEQARHDAAPPKADTASAAKSKFTAKRFAPKIIVLSAVFIILAVVIGIVIQSEKDVVPTDDKIPGAIEKAVDGDTAANEPSKPETSKETKEETPEKSTDKKIVENVSKRSDSNRSSKRESPKAEIIRYRRDAKELGVDEVKTMLKAKKFFDSRWNPEGKGIVHHYEPKTIGGDKVVIDHKTGLWWQQGGSSNYMGYENAKKEIENLKQNGYAGYNDWRLPTLEEAMSLMEPEKKHGDLFIDQVFDKTQRYIWTADGVKGGSRAWVVYFGLGGCGYYYLYYSLYCVRAVRSGQSSAR
ncbi:DUF1566 domain-containing protein [candidate division KSB1 bacterium]|nr:DUF1566 domain-containing protein [candidate division KSB1 bacterium]